MTAYIVIPAAVREDKVDVLEALHLGDGAPLVAVWVELGCRHVPLGVWVEGSKLANALRAE